MAGDRLGTEDWDWGWELEHGDWVFGAGSGIRGPGSGVRGLRSRGAAVPGGRDPAGGSNGGG